MLSIFPVNAGMLTGCSCKPTDSKLTVNEACFILTAVWSTAKSGAASLSLAR